MVLHKCIFLEGDELNRNVFSSIFLVHNHHSQSLTAQCLAIFTDVSLTRNICLLTKFFFMPRLPQLDLRNWKSEKRVLRTCFKNSLSQCNIKVVLKSTNRLSCLFRFKDVTPKKSQYHIVNKFSCGNCYVATAKLNAILT